MTNSVKNSASPMRIGLGGSSLTESALRNWVKQSKIDRQGGRHGPLTSEEREELNNLRRELKRVQMERDFLKKAATFFAKESSNPMS